MADQPNREFVIRGEDVAFVEAPPSEAHNEGQIKYLIAEENVGARRLKLMLQKYPVGGSTGERPHPILEQAYYILKGQMKVRVGGKEYIAKAGDCVFIPKNTLHDQINEGPGDLEFLTFNCRWEDSPKVPERWDRDGA